jgi:hypothetical protein
MGYNLFFVLFSRWIHRITRNKIVFLLHVMYDTLWKISYQIVNYFLIKKSLKTS